MAGVKITSISIRRINKQLKNSDNLNKEIIPLLDGAWKGRHYIATAAISQKKKYDILQI